MIGTFLSDSSNQRKIAVALAAALGLFSAKLPFLANVSPEIIMTVIGAIGAWILQSGAKAAVEAHADGQLNKALVENAPDAVAVFQHIANGVPLPANLVPKALPAQPGAPSAPVPAAS